MVDGDGAGVGFADGEDGLVFGVMVGVGDRVDGEDVGIIAAGEADDEGGEDVPPPLQPDNKQKATAAESSAKGSTTESEKR